MATATLDRPAGLAASAARSDTFRSDINGLRAISIALVMAYHLGGGIAPGGFVGVDVFFVISGFLMSQIILGGLDAGRFTLRGFYLARLRRIGPALAALCAGLWLFGAVFLDPWTFQDLASKLPLALLMVSNFSFAGGGYFAQDSSTNWLLHTWSLGVEWQFYLIFPLVLLALARPGRWRWIALGALAVASFGLALALGKNSGKLDFYLLPSRAWELLAGGFCCPLVGRIRLPPIARWGLHASGLAMIAAGAFLARPGLAWPSFMTLLPVGGACAALLAEVKRTYWAEIPAIDALGRASYSIYLWHWPVMVWLHDARIELTPLVAMAALAVMLALGFASYHLVERRLTRWLFAPQHGRWALGGAVAAATLGLALLAAATHGLEGLRTIGDAPATKAALVDDRNAQGDWAFPKVCFSHVEKPIPLCRIGDPAARRVLVIGDSNAQQVAPRFAHAFDSNPGGGVTFATIAGCLPIPAVSGKASPFCGQDWARIYRYAETAGFARVVVIAAWSRYLQADNADPLGQLRVDGQTQPTTMEGLAEAGFARLGPAVQRLRSRGIEVVLMAATPHAEGADPRALYTKTFWRGQPALPPPLSRASQEKIAALSLGHLRQIAAATGAVLVDPLDGLCDGNVCPTMEAGRTLYKDQGHYRASMLTSPRFAYLDRWLAPGVTSAPTRLK